MCDIRLFRSARMDYETAKTLWKNNGANLTVTDWVDDHSEMLSEWEAETRYNMDFMVEKRKLDRAMDEIDKFFRENGIQKELRRELQDEDRKERLLNCLPESRRGCNDFELNCYYIMFQKKVEGISGTKND